MSTYHEGGKMNWIYTYFFCWQI